MRDEHRAFQPVKPAPPRRNVEPDYLRAIRWATCNLAGNREWQFVPKTAEV
jgi:hypothetical protein